MDVLVRELRHAHDGTLESTDKEFNGEIVTIGSAPDQTIQLIGREIAPQHATIMQSSGGVKLTCHSGQIVTVNQHPETAVELQRGDVIDLGAHRLRLIAAPSGFDIALEVELSDKVNSSEFEAAFQTDLKQAFLRKRTIAWVSSLIILVGFLVIPLTLLSLHYHGVITHALPSDKLWNPGPLSAAHQHAIGNDCSTCHQTLFKRVRDDACLSCHKTVVDHVSPQHLALTEFGDKPRCATCHREHFEPLSQLIIADNSLCMRCHAKAAAAFGSLSVQRVAGFSSDSHPEFTLHLLKSMPQPVQIAADTALEWREELVKPAGATENSHLKFPHAVHLDPAHVTRVTDSQPMNCVDCHALDTDGERFTPITMKANCASCHDLTFDIADPSRQLPHGKPREAIQMLQDYYARKFIDPAAFNAHKVERRRIPGRSEEEDSCSAPPLFCAKQETLKQVDMQFNVRGCVTCHAVIDTHSEDLANRFQVTPVRLTEDYYPGARFKHSSHLIQGNLTGDDACLSCHQAKQSKRSQDVLIPGIDRCLSCHSSRATDTNHDAVHDLENNVVKHDATIVLGCIACHDYHPDKH